MDIIHVTDLLTVESIRKLREQIFVHHKRTRDPITLFIENTTAEGAVAENAMAEAVNFYMNSDLFPHLRTIAGPCVWHAGFVLFLAGHDRRMMPNASFKCFWNLYTATLLVGETKKRHEEAFEIFKGKNYLTAFQFSRLGIADGYFIGNLPSFHEALTKASRAP